MNGFIIKFFFKKKALVVNFKTKPVGTSFFLCLFFPFCEY